MEILGTNFNRLSRVVFAVSVASTMAFSSASAQGAEGNWGAEGRIGSGQSAYLLRYLNPSWSLVMGGGASTTTSDLAGTNAKNDNRSASATVMLRKDMGTGRVKPFLGIGPTLGYTHTKITSTSGATSTTEVTNNNIAFGARGEFGGFVPVSPSVSLGLAASATLTRNSTKTKSGTSPESKTTSTGTSIGNPQFLIRIRF